MPIILSMDTPIRPAIDADAAYRGLLARDARLDGHLFVGVTSTGVYCRPICRVRPPRRENCRFFETPAQAEAAAFRPCLKCRPEIAPGPGFAWSVMDASRTLARQAALWLDAHAHVFDDAESANLAALARHLGVSDRHLRRIFAAEHGVTPLQYLQTRRLLLAKQLLTDTAMPISQVAHASGFRSLRRFNAAFAGNYRLTPSRLRRDAAPDSSATDEALCVTLAFREPLAREALLRFLAQRAIPGVEQVEVDALRVRRTVRPGTGGERGGWIEVVFVPAAAATAVALLGLAHCRGGLAAGGDPSLAGPRRRPAGDRLRTSGLPGDDGLRLPGGVDAFELAVRAVLGQQVTVAAARTLAGRLVERFGAPIDHALGRTRPLLSGACGAGGPCHRADRRTRRHPHPRHGRDRDGRRRGPNCSRCCNAAAAADTASSNACAPCPASDRGRRTTSRCARSAGAMRSRPATWPC